MKIERKGNKIFIDGECAGTVKNWCCGVDFYPLKHPKAIFSILYKKELKKGIEIIKGLKIPEGMDFRFTIYPSRVLNEKDIKKIQRQLNESKAA